MAVLLIGDSAVREHAGEVRTIIVGALLAAVTCGRSLAAEPIPDFTKGDKPGKQEWYLHLHGAMGHVYRETERSRQIYITKVPGDSPVRKMLRPGDVIVGLNGKPFSEDALWTLRNACHAARKAEPAEMVSFLRWRNGEVTSHSINMEGNPAPDLLKGETKGIDRRLTWNLGPTGMRGWIYSRWRTNLDLQQGRITARSRQILVTDVGDNSPAEGVMKVNDVIVGVGGKLFSADARQSIARAITEAEKEENSGALKLRIWRVPALTPEQKKALLDRAAEEAVEDTLEAGEPEETEDETPGVDGAKGIDEEAIVRENAWRLGETMDVELELEVMGSYSKTAPYDCPKSAKILAQACKVLEKEMLEKIPHIWGGISGLALLATGNAEYLPKVQTYARSLAAKEVERKGGGAWDCGYRSVFLCEYYLLSGDKEVLPAIKVLTLKMAKGQGRYGTFGHGFSARTPEGKLHGSIPPYGAVNQAGLIVNFGIVLGRKCGVQDPEVRAAIERACKFFGYYVDKGAIPYGEHDPFMCHDNNGKSALAAIMFGVQGDRWLRETRYFASMATAGYANRQYGHTGQGFGYLWSALGANVGGPRAAAAFFNEIAWHLDLVRRSDGAFTYDGGEQCGPGLKDGDKNTYYGDASYYGMSPTATYVLAYALPLKKLLITGRDASPRNHLSEKEVAGAIASGRFDLDRKHLSAPQLVAALGDWSPIARRWAAEELAKRPEATAMVPELLKLAEGDGEYSRRGACEALGLINSKDALPVLVRLLEHEDRDMRTLAAEALTRMGDTVRSVLEEVLRIVIATDESSAPVNWRDPVQLAQGALARLAVGLLNRSFKGVDKKLLYPAIRVIARNPSGRTRATLVQILRSKLSPEDVQALGPVILESLRTKAPADTMFRNELPMAAAAVLSKYHYREGTRAIVGYAKGIDFHGSQNRVPLLMKMLSAYGAGASEVLPELRALLAEYRKPHYHARLQKMKAAAVEETIRVIETDKNPPELRSIVK